MFEDLNDNRQDTSIIRSTNAKNIFTISKSKLNTTHYWV